MALSDVVSKKDELLLHRMPINETSIDSSNNVCMVDAGMTVVNFDGVAAEYCRKCCIPYTCSVDALHCDIGGKNYLIEFKNGKLDKGKIYEVKQKIYDSLLILSDLTDLTLRDFRKELEFILVYNEEKNPNLFGVIPSPSNSPALRGLACDLSAKAGKQFEEEGLDSFEGYCFRRVRKMTVAEFTANILAMSRSAWD